jgi:hypothetical protein
MPTLYLSAPKIRTQAGAFYRDFYTILQNHVGPDYAIYANIAAQIHPGMHVVIFDRDRQLHAEGTISAIIAKPSTRIQRYDVRVSDLKSVKYSYPPYVNRCGVALV